LLQVLEAAQALLTDEQLRASPLAVQDDYASDLLAADQSGADAVLTFNLGSAVKLVAVDVDPIDPDDTSAYIARAIVGGGTPSITLGWRCRSGQTTYIPISSASGTIKVYAPTGVSVSVAGAAR